MNKPARKSYLDLIKSNLAAIDKPLLSRLGDILPWGWRFFQTLDPVQFITRLVYVGAYHGTDESLQKRFQNVVNQLGSEYPDAPVTGLLLIYPQYFLHVIETSEEMIVRHLSAIFYCKEMSINLGRVLPLPPHHHVHRPFFPRWFKVYTKPPKLLEKLEGSGSAEVERRLTDCLSKVYTLCEYVSTAANGSVKRTEEILQSLKETEQRYLPESTIIDFLLNAKSPILRDIREYIDIASLPPYIRLYNDIIWPPTCDFVPSEVFVEHASRRDFMLKRLSQQQQLQRQK